MKKKSFWTFLSENIFSLLSIAIGIAVIILQGVGVIQGDVMSTAILALLATLATSQIVEANRKFDGLENQIEKEFRDIVISLNGVGVKKFPTPEQGFEYLTQLLGMANTTIDHIAMADFLPRWSRQHNLFTQTRDKILKKNKIHYRYIINSGTISPKKIENLRQWIDNPEFKRLHVACYELPQAETKNFPYPSIMIIDSSEVFIYFPHSIGESEITYAIRHPLIVEMFSDYFKRVWSTAAILNSSLLNEISLAKNKSPDINIVKEK